MSKKQSVPWSEDTEGRMYELGESLHHHLYSDPTDDATTVSLISELRAVADKLEQELVTFKDRK